jgi:ABC-type dipeptide/oligopeptide/nickel transport system permease component
MARRSPARVIGGRLLQAVPVILLATFMVFALLKLVPGDIAVTLAGDNATDARITETERSTVSTGRFWCNTAPGSPTSCRATSRNRR